MNWRIGLYVYLLLGAVFVLWQSRTWWREASRIAHELNWNSGWTTKTGVVFIVLVSLYFDVVLWPRCVWRWYRSRGESK